MTNQTDAPAVTLDALIYELREDGVAALATPNCQRRLRAISPAQKAEIVTRLNALSDRHPKIADQLILRIRSHQ